MRKKLKGIALQISSNTSMFTNKFMNETYSFIILIYVLFMFQIILDSKDFIFIPFHFTFEETTISHSYRYLSKLQKTRLFEDEFVCIVISHDQSRQNLQVLQFVTVPN